VKPESPQVLVAILWSRRALVPQTEEGGRKVDDASMMLLLQIQTSLIRRSKTDQIKFNMHVASCNHHNVEALPRLCGEMLLQLDMRTMNR
jgi:hypothetical protein